jgi:predicted SprT family Zn-dependent metalloprotease
MATSPTQDLLTEQHQVELVEEILLQASKTFPLGRPFTWGWGRFRTTAGTADFVRFHISLNRKLLVTEGRLRLTTLHEYAHLLAVARSGIKGRGHGPAWRQAMKDLGLPCRVRHDYEVTRNSSKQVVIYACQKCQAKFPRRRALPRKGTYVHARCGGALKLLERVLVTTEDSLP